MIEKRRRLNWVPKELPSKPLIVVDLSTLISWPTGFVPTNFDIVVPQVILDEVAGHETNRSENKFFNTLFAHPKTFWFATDMLDLVQRERSPSKTLPPWAFIDILQTIHLRQLIANKPTALLERYKQSRSEKSLTDSYKANKRNLQEFQSTFIPAPGPQPEWLRPLCDKFDHEEMIAFLRDPTALLKCFGNFPKYAHPEWQKVLTTFPDQKAIGRWYRIELWYCMMNMTGRTKDMANRWEDAQYAFAASYVGRIATKDDQLKQLVSHIFPDVEVVEPT